jgi:hypothetical protein
VAALREFHVTPHVAQNDRNRKSAIDKRTTRHKSYQISQAKRSWVEKPFGWMKWVGLMRKVKLRGREKLWWLFTLTAAAFNLWRIPKLQVAAKGENFWTSKPACGRAWDHPSLTRSMASSTFP